MEEEANPIKLDDNKPYYDRPFDVAMKLPPCFRKLVSKRKIDEKFSLDLGELWDPFIIACRFQENKYDIQVNDFFDEAPVLYTKGVAQNDYDDATEGKSPRKRRARGSPKKQKQSPTKRQNPGSPHTNQAQKQEQPAARPPLTTTGVKDIICKHIKEQQIPRTAITGKLLHSLNGIAREILQKVDGETFSVDTVLIEKDDLLDKE